MIELHNLRPPAGTRRGRKRLGRGPGSGTGKTSGRGEKGQNSRSGGGVPPWFEGGQMPLQRRIPKRGFKNRNRTEYQVVNVGSLERLPAECEARPETLKKVGLIRSLRVPVKILGMGEIAVAVHASVHAVSAPARRKIESAGGSVTILPQSRGAAPASRDFGEGNAQKADRPERRSSR